MPEVIGYRANNGVIILSIDTVVEAGCNDLRIAGMTFHAGRMVIEHVVLDPDGAFRALPRPVDGSCAPAMKPPP